MDWMFSRGDRVRIIESPTKYGSELIDRTGTVKSSYYNSVSVAVDGLTNNRGTTGLFYMAPFQLEPIAIEETQWVDVTPDTQKYINYDLKSVGEALARFQKDCEELYNESVKKKEETPMLKNYKVAGIKFQDSWQTDKTYPYALYDEDIAIGDLVVVMTGHHGLTIAEVCSIGEFNKDAVSCGREIICKVDMGTYNDRQARAKQMAALKMEMDAKVKALQEVALYELMAEKDPELKAMLETFKALEL